MSFKRAAGGRRVLLVGLALMGVMGVSCSREPASALSRVAVLRFENLSPDVSLDWMGRAASDIIAHELDSGQTKVISPGTLHANPLTQSRPVSAPGESVERSAALADGATRIVMGQISQAGNRLILDVTESDATTGKTIQSFTVAAPDTGDLYSVADAAARHLSPKVNPFDSRNNEAIAFWARGMEETDYDKATGDYARAAQADPNFAQAWLAWSGTVSAHGDRAAAEKILAEAQQHANRFNDIDRARLKLASVQLTGDRAAVLAALNEFARLRPDDVDNVRAVADQNFTAHAFQAAASGYRRLTQLSPDDPAVWNQLGYTLMYSGDYNGAMSAIEHYQRLAPKDVNAIDSQGDIALAFGRFSEAEKFYDQSASRDPNFQNSTDLYKAAMARLMTGDVAGADKKFEAYIAARTNASDAAVPFRTAAWRFLSGRHDEGFAALTKLAAGPQPQMKALALTQMAIWDLELGRRDRALQESSDAIKSGAALPSTLIARFASEDIHSAAEWSARADRMLSAPQLVQVKPLALGYALYLSHQWQAAEALWKQLAERASPDDSITPVIYARILVGLNRVREAAPYVRLFPLVHPDGPQEFVGLAFPEIFDVRAVMLAAEGKSAEAEASRKIFRILWGTAGV